METSQAMQQGPSRSPYAESVRTAESGRPNIYSNPHKGLRLFMTDTLGFAGRIDPQDDADVAALAAQVRSLLRFCRAHLEKEEQFVHPAMEARRPGSSAGTRGDHRDHLAAAERVGAGLSALEAADGRERDAAAVRLYRHLALFVADNLVHMHAEETENNETLWACYGDDELVALDQRIVASIPQDMIELALRWMVPAMNPAERAALLRGIRARAPAAAFEAILAGAQASLGETERCKLGRALAA